MRHIHYDENINAMHLFEEEMHTEMQLKKKKCFENMKYWSPSQKPDIIVVEKVFLKVTLLSAWSTFETYLVFMALLCYYDTRKNILFLCISSIFFN